MNDDDSLVFSRTLRTMQIICGALIAGVGSFLLIAVYLREQGGLGGAIPPPTLSLVAVLYSVGAIGAVLLVPGRIVASARQRIARGTWQPVQRNYGIPLPTTDEGRLLQVYQTAMIVRAALCEGAAFFWIIVYLMEGPPWLLVGAGVFLLGVLLQFPTAARVEAWLTAQLQQLEEDRLSIASETPLENQP